MSVDFVKNTHLNKALFNWWTSLKYHKGERAELRRAQSIRDVQLSPSFHRACRSLEEHFDGEADWQQKLAPVIGLLAHVRTPVQESLAFQMAGYPPLVSEQRFYRLLRCEGQDLYIAMMRILHQLEKKASILDLANSIYHWGDEVKRRWVAGYFADTAVESPEGERHKALHDWWSGMDERTGERAELCRAKSVDDVLLSQAFHRACNVLAPHFHKEQGWEKKLAPVIGLLAHVRISTDQALAEQMAVQVNGGSPVVSELRFRRLIQRNEQDLYVAMIRVLRMLDKKASIPDLADSVYHWDDKVKQRWALAYFAKIPVKKASA